MFQRKISGAAGLLLFALAITSCGSSGASNSGPTTAVPSTASTPPATAAAPTAAQLRQTLDLISSADKPVSDKVAVVVDGEKRRGNLAKLTAALQGYALTYDVSRITVTGNTAQATVDVTSPHGSMPMPMSWQLVDGVWKLSDASDCQLLAMGGPPTACS
jgi:hypothetical protein